MAGNYKIKIEPILNTASLNKQLNETKKLKLSDSGKAAGNSYGTGFARALKERFKYSIANALIYGTQNAVKDMVNNVRELDAAQTELRKVTDLSGKSLKDFTNEAYQVGNRVAKTGTEIVQASTEFAKMGKDTKTSLQLSELATRFQNIADTEIDAATAAKFINSQLKAFGNTSTLKKFTTDFSKAERIIDVTNDTANKFAVGTNDLQNALTKTGSAMSVAGNSFEQTIGMVTAGTEIMVGQPAKVGRGLRSIAINIANLAKESDKFQAANGKVDIELQKSNGEMRSTYDIMNDLGEVWGDLNETEQTSIATALAGKTQFEVFANVMKNWGAATRVVKNAIDANGSSLRENAKYLDSIEGKIQAFQSAWEQLSYHLVNSDTIKGVIDLGTSIITTIDDIVQKIGVLPTLIGAVGTAIGGLRLLKVAENFIGIGSAAEEAAEGIEAIASASAVTSGAKGLGGLKNIIGFLTNPAVLGGIATLGVVLGSIAFEKYFSLGSSIERLNDYQDKLKEVTTEIEQLNEKRGTDEGLTRAEAIHLDVLKAEERSLERQVELEKQRVQNAFIKDSGASRKGETGLKEVKSFQSSRTAELDIYKQLEEKQKMIDDARLKLGYAYATHDEKSIERYKNVLKIFDKEEQALNKKLTETQSHVADASSELAQYFEKAVASVDYESLTKEQQASFDDMHKAFLQSKLDIGSLESDYQDFVTIISSAVDSLGYDSIDIFSGIDFSKITTLNDLITGIKNNLKELDGDKEISFKVKDKDGNIDTITKKISELTDKDIQSIISFNPEGIEQVEAEADNAARDRTSNVNVTDNNTAANVDGAIDNASADRTANVKVTDNNTANNVQGEINSIKGKDVHINIFRTIWESIKHKAKGKHKGEEGGMAWLGDEGSSNNPKPELVVSEDGTAYLAGTKGWELYNLKDSDTVYTASETKRLLGGKQSFLGNVGQIPRYAKGKKGKKKKREEFDKKLDRLEHKRKVNHWTDAKFQKEYKKLYKKYKKYLSKDQKWDYSESREDYQNNAAVDKFKRQAEDIVTQSDLDRFINKVKNSKNLSKDEKNEIIADARSEFWNNQFKRQSEDIISEEDLLGYISSVNKNAHLTKQEKDELIQSAGNKYYSDEFDRQLGILSVRGNDRTDINLANYISDVRNNQYLTEQEKEKFARDAYEAVAKYNLKEYENGVKTRDETLASIEAYYAEVGKYDETYYQMLDDLREADKEKEMDRLKELQETHENRLSLAEKYVRKELNIVQKQIDAEKEEADALEKLNELEKDVAKAKSNKVRVYREGIGFVYERDTEAIEKAEKALSDYQRTLNKTPLEQYAEELQGILDLFDELQDEADMHDLEVKLGVGSLSQLLGGNFGTNRDLWSKWLKSEYANVSGYEDLIDKLGDVATSQLDSWLTSNGGTQVSDSVISSYLNKHKFATGTISANGGLSLVGENGAELAWLGKGDSVFSNNISRNLMEWGRYSPAQVANAMNKSNSNQIFNFDKIILPNVRNAEDFYRELKSLPNKALQQSTQRI
jgi:TP901 family phage tail tape measure protein